MGSVGHIYVFWRQDSCLYLVIASCPGVADGLQYIPTAHCAESPGSHDKAARSECTLLCGCEEKHDVTVWNQKLVWKILQALRQVKL